MGRDCLQAMPCKEEENKRSAVKHLFLIPRKERFFADAQNDKATKGKMTKKKLIHFTAGFGISAEKH